MKTSYSCLLRTVLHICRGDPRTPNQSCYKRITDCQEASAQRPSHHEIPLGRSQHTSYTATVSDTSRTAVIRRIDRMTHVVRRLPALGSTAASCAPRVLSSRPSGSTGNVATHPLPTCGGASLPRLGCLSVLSASHTCCRRKGPAASCEDYGQGDSARSPARCMVSGSGRHLRDLASISGNLANSPPFLPQPHDRCLLPAIEVRERIWMSEQGLSPLGSETRTPRD